jgi:LysR family transcriptional activator of nhaA
MKWINYHHLIYFKEIATLGSISKASEVLKVGQPALSSQLKSLEEYLGIQLFERKNRKLILTDSGKVALEYATKISDLGQELIQVIEDKVFTRELHLSVGALDNIPKNLISEIVDFAHKKTNCFLSIFEGPIDELLREMIMHKIEVLISDHEATSLRNKNIYSKKILSRPIFAYAAPAYKGLRRNFPESLDKAPCIVPTEHSKLRKNIEHFFRINGLRPKFIAETQDTSLQKILAVKGDGVIFLPNFTTKSLIQEKKLIKIGELEQVFSEYYLIYSKRLIENPALDLVIKQNFDKMRLG